MYMCTLYLSEFLRGVGVITLVRVKLERQLTEGAFDLSSTGRLLTQTHYVGIVCVCVCVCACVCVCVCVCIILYQIPYLPKVEKRV